MDEGNTSRSGHEDVNGETQKDGMLHGWVVRSIDFLPLFWTRRLNA